MLPNDVILVIKSFIFGGDDCCKHCKIDLSYARAVKVRTNERFAGHGFCSKICKEFADSKKDFVYEKYVFCKGMGYFTFDAIWKIQIQLKACHLTYLFQTEEATRKAEENALVPGYVLSDHLTTLEFKTA